MQIDKPKWDLKIVCPHCEQGFPTFVSCPNCSYLTVQCNETGDTFLNPNNSVYSAIVRCVFVLPSLNINSPWALYFVIHNLILIFKKFHRLFQSLAKINPNFPSKIFLDF